MRLHLTTVITLFVSMSTFAHADTVAEAAPSASGSSVPSAASPKSENMGYAWVSADCGVKTAMGPQGQEVGAPDLSLFLDKDSPDTPLLSSAVESIFDVSFDEDANSIFHKGTVLSVVGNQVFIQSSSDSSKKILIGSTSIALRDLQKNLPQCRIRSNNSASSKRVKLTGVNPGLKVQQTGFSKTCTARSWQFTEGKEYELADGKAKLTGGTTGTTYIPDVNVNLEVSDGNVTIPFAVYQITLADDEKYPFEGRYLGFQSKDNCEKYIQSIQR